MSQQDVEVDDVADELEDAEEPGGPEGLEGASAELSDLELEGDIAADYVEGLLDIADLDGDIAARVSAPRCARPHRLLFDRSRPVPSGVARDSRRCRA